MNEAVITLKLSDNEIDLLVNSLEMLENPREHPNAYQL